MKEEASLNIPTIVALLLLFLLLTVRLVSSSIFVFEEARNALCAKEMHRHSDVVVPADNGELQMDKPLHYFFMMAAYKIVGVSSFSARFFSVVLAVLTVLSTMLFANRFRNRQAAFLTGLVLLCSTLLMLPLRLAVPDPCLRFFTTAALMGACVGAGIVPGRQQKNRMFFTIASSVSDR